MFNNTKSGVFRVWTRSRNSDWALNVFNRKQIVVTRLQDVITKNDLSLPKPIFIPMEASWVLIQRMKIFQNPNKEIVIPKLGDALV